MTACGRRAALRGAAAAVLAGGAHAAEPPRGRERDARDPGQGHFFRASDGARLHYLEAGANSARTIVLVPGWTMPAWIFAPQIAHFRHRHRVIAFDPRGQGSSEVTATGYDHVRRAGDIADLLARIGGPPVVLLAWSLAVLEALALLRLHGEARLAGLVLVDNSVGEEPPPPAYPPPKVKPPHEVAMRRFVGGMFATPQSPAYLERLSRATLRLPEPASKALLGWPVPRSYWREAIYATSLPLLYIVRPKFAGQARNLERKHPSAEVMVWGNEVGHAMFVDAPGRFNAAVQDFLARRVWP
jgi:microsomal epoxide hydrolase